MVNGSTYHKYNGFVNTVANGRTECEGNQQIDKCTLPRWAVMCFELVVLFFF